MPRRRGRGIMLRRLSALLPPRMGGAVQRLIPPQRRHVEHLNRRGELGIGHVEWTDHRREPRQGEAERSEIQRLVVAHESRIGLWQQCIQRLGTRNPRKLLIRARQLRLRARTEGSADGVAERETERLRLCPCGDGNGEKEKRKKSFQQHAYKSPRGEAAIRSPPPNDRSVSSEVKAISGGGIPIDTAHNLPDEKDECRQWRRTSPHQLPTTSRVRMVSQSLQRPVVFGWLHQRRTSNRCGTIRCARPPRLF